MKTILYPGGKDWLKLTERPSVQVKELNALVNEVFEKVNTEGDKAVLNYTKQFDKVNLKSLQVNEETIKNASQSISLELKQAIKLAKRNIEKFHQAQTESSKKTETTKGVICWRESRPIEKVGIYIPGGTAPLFSTVLMLGVPAKLAGCKEIILCTPPNERGEISPAILYTASLVGITKIFGVGGMQAIAAMTFGTKSIARVDKIFGPGNQYVTAAKQVAQNFGVAIDLPAGPSEVLIIADKTCEPTFVAADLLSQAEHGIDSQVILLSDNKAIMGEVLIELKAQLKKLPRKEIAEAALKNSKAIVLKSINDCIEFSNLYAPEHLILAMKDSKKLISKISNAGSVFLGNYSCESAGDYASGTNHTLPTNGYVRNYSGVSLDSFVKKITFQQLSKQGIKKIGPAIEIMAETEQLFAHKNAVTLRLKNL
ncbi:MAG TPA: histidinol dehydrogenase [Bacteroidia bacterium]|jgi:histidinol dehydrogenase|nr:histidinol dehydrogenase [Bacteroidia bacterium]